MLVVRFNNIINTTGKGTIDIANILQLIFGWDIFAESTRNNGLLHIYGWFLLVNLPSICVPFLQPPLLFCFLQCQLYSITLLNSAALMDLNYYLEKQWQHEMRIHNLTLSWRRPLSYKNQSISKSMDWFLYDNGLRLERVNKKWAKQADLHKIWNKLFNVMTEMHLVFLIKVTQYISGASWCYRLSSMLPTIHSPSAF